MWVQIDISSSSPSTLCRSTDHQYMWNSFIRVFKAEQPVDVFVCIIKSSCIGSSIIDVFVSQNVVKSVNPILTVTWHLSYHPPVSIYSGMVRSAVASCVWSESNKTNMDFKIPHLTCSPTVRNSCFSQNKRHANFLEKLIQKAETWPKMGLILNPVPRWNLAP